MALTQGTRLGPYAIVGSIGAGGMGEVYRATDTNLDRQVAIKVLPEAFANDSERLARFEREAKTLAALNHPRIAQIYGLEKSGGVQAGELFYRVGTKVMMTRVATRPDLTVGSTELLFDGPQFSPINCGYDVTADGRRLLLVKENDQSTSATQISVVLNWTRELVRQLPH